MAGVSKANQRQSQKRKSSKNYGFKRVRLKEIPYVCPVCHNVVNLSSALAYKAGGNFCRKCSTDKIQVRLQVGKLPPPKLTK
jgi:hypothetical protein